MSYLPHVSRFKPFDFENGKAAPGSDELSKPQPSSPLARKSQAANAPEWPRDHVTDQEIDELLKILQASNEAAERNLAWIENRSRGEGFRVTVSWDPEISPTEADLFTIPRITDVLEAVLIGSARNQDDLDHNEEFELYAMVVRDLAARVQELRSRYE